MARLLFPMLLAATAAIATADAQPVPAPQAETPSEAIVVQGVRDTRKEIGRFVDALTDAPVLGQLSRFNWAVCPTVVGLGHGQGKAIEQRMLAVAEAAAIPVARPGCSANVFVIVTRDKKALISELHRKFPAYFAGVTRHAVKQLKRDPSPTAAWHVEGKLDADGVEVNRDKIQGHDVEVIERTDSPSRLTTSTRPHFIASILVVDVDALNGLTTIQLADYAAMRAFARTDPRRLNKSAAPSILSAVEAPMMSAVPVTLTEWDLAFLKSLYASDPDVRAMRQRNEMKQIVRRSIEDQRKADE